MTKARIAKLESREVLAGIDWAIPGAEPSYQTTDIQITFRAGSLWWRVRMAMAIIFRPGTYHPIIEMEVKKVFRPPILPEQEDS